MSPSLSSPGGALDAALIDREQTAVHGFAWMATYVEALRQIRGWASRLDEAGEFGEAEALILRVAFGEYLAQLAGGIAMSQARNRPARTISACRRAEIAPLRGGDAARLVAGLGEARSRLAALTRGGRRRRRSGAIALDDPTLEMIRDQVRRFAERAVAPFAHDWHRADRLIPIEVIDELAAIGVFGMTLPEEHGGLGLGKIAMCVVSEELSRAYIGVGSLGTRSEIAGELIRARRHRGAEGALAARHRLRRGVADRGLHRAEYRLRPRQRADPRRARRRGLPHFRREDLDHPRRARRSDDAAGAHRPARAAAIAASACSSRRSRAATMPTRFRPPGMSGTEIPVLGYRGMKEYEIAFDGFAVPAEGLLGGVEGQGFKQLMATFESARVQTAARAVGVAQNALELGLAYALERSQFGAQDRRLPAGRRTSSR